MAKVYLMPLIAAAAATILTIVGATAMARSPASYGNNVASLYDNRWHRHGAGERRSHQGAVLNGLTNLSGLGHISNGYGSVAPTKQETPIYEEHNEDAAVAAVAATAHDQHQHQHQPHYPAGGGFLPAFGGYGSWGLSSPEEQQPYAYEKISMGNFLPHSGYEGHQQEQVYQQQEANYQKQEELYQQRQEELYQQQRQGEQQQHSTYFSPHGETSASGSAASATSGSAADDYEEHPGDGQEQSSNYLAESPSGHSQHSHHVDIINYVPVKHVKQQHVPVEKPVKIPISHAVIIPVRRPVPIHIPITKTIQVPVERELKVPVERVVGVPVEKHIPVPVEKHVPYEVIKYVPIKVPKPFPVKVPVFKTVLHKVKSWW